MATDPPVAPAADPADARLSVHDGDLPAQAVEVVDAGLGAFNEGAAPLEQVRPLACFARVAGDRVIGGAVGRRWGECCELQQLWVLPEARGRGLGTRLLRAFEAQAQACGCRQVYLETWSFQARPFYAARGYELLLELRGYGPGLAKYTMRRWLGSAPAGA